MTAGQKESCELRAGAGAGVAVDPGAPMGRLAICCCRREQQQQQQLAASGNCKNIAAGFRCRNVVTMPVPVQEPEPEPAPRLLLSSRCYFKQLQFL